MRLPKLTSHHLPHGTGGGGFTGAGGAGAGPGVVPMQCVTGTLDTDFVVYQNLGPAELANLRATSTACRDSVDAYVQYLIASDRLRYIFVLDEDQALDGTDPGYALRLWRRGDVRRV